MAHPPIITRFAPSPTGLLHLGHAFSAASGAALARSAGGSWLVRIEDLDSGRCRPAFTAAILEDLAWLGLTPDAEPLLQSTRKNAHAEALEKLRVLGFTYPCFCTRADIAAAAAAPHGAVAPYPGTCRALPSALAEARARAEPHAIRLNAGRASAFTCALSFTEGDADQPADPLAAGDMVLARKDIGVGYMLAAVVDDGWQGVTDVVRGHDLLASTPTQRLLQALLGLPAPRYHHHRLLLAADGRRLAKRDQAETLAALRSRGVDGPALARHLADLPLRGADIHLHPK